MHVFIFSQDSSYSVLKVVNHHDYKCCGNSKINIEFLTKDFLFCTSVLK